MDLCVFLSASWLRLLPPLRGLEILTGEPLMLTKALVLPTDFFLSGFCTMEEAGLMEGTGLLAGEDGGKSFFGEGGTTGEGWGFPPSWKPLPLNGMRFLMSCDTETEGK